MRSLKAPLFCGIVASLIAIGLFEAGAFRALDGKLAALFGYPGIPAPSRGLQYFITLLLAFGIAWTTIDIARLPLKLLIAAVAFAEVVATSCVLALFGVFFSPFAALFATVAGTGAGLIWLRRTPGDPEQQTLERLLLDRVSPPTFRALLDSGGGLKFSGESKDATVLICEIFNREELMQLLGPAEYVSMTDAFLRTASEFLVERGAYLDEFKGEGLRVVFGGFLNQQEHPSIACLAALELQARLDAVNRECDAHWGGRIDYRLGVNTGEMVVGMYGPAGSSSVTVTGEPVDFAHRLCTANTIFSTRTLIGEASWKRAQATIEVRPIELIQRRRDEENREAIYELLAAHGKLSGDDVTRRDLFTKAIEMFRGKKWDDALANFRLARELAPEDGPADFYIRRIEQMRAGTGALDRIPT